MGSAFHMLCPRYSGPLTSSAPTATRLWEIFSFYLVTVCYITSMFENEQANFLTLLSGVRVCVRACVGV